MTVNAVTTSGHPNNYRIISFSQLRDNGRTIVGTHHNHDGTGMNGGLYYNPLEMVKHKKLVSLSQEQAMRETYFNPATRPNIDFERKGGFIGSAWRCGGNFVKGATTGFLKSAYRGIFCDENGKFSPGKTMMSAIKIGSLAAVSVMFPPAGLAIGSYFLVKSGANLFKNGTSCASNLFSGNYEAAEEQAFMVGENTTGTALSAWGTMAALRGVQAAAGSTPKTYGEMVRSPYATVKEIGAQLKSGQNWKSGWQNFKTNIFKPFKKAESTLAESVKETNQAATTQAAGTTSTILDSSGKPFVSETAQEAAKAGFQESLKQGAKKATEHVKDSINKLKELPGKEAFTQTAKNIYKEGIQKAEKGIYATAIVANKDSAEDSLNPYYSKNNPFKYYSNTDAFYPQNGHVHNAENEIIGGGSSYQAAITPAVGVGM